jgi:hypothetical protein
MVHGRILQREQKLYVENESVCDPVSTSRFLSKSDTVKLPLKVARHFTHLAILTYNKILFIKGQQVDTLAARVLSSLQVPAKFMY